MKLLHYLCLCWILAVSAVWAQTPPPFEMPTSYSVEMKTTSPEMGKEIVNKIYVSGEKSRIESMVEGNHTIAIVRMDRKIMYTLVPDQKMYMEMPLITGQDNNDPTRIPENATWEKLGEESVDGIPCEKYRCTTHQGGMKSEMFYWIDRKQNAPVKVKVQNMETRWSRFDKAPQNDQLFEPPAGYQKMSIGI